MYIDDPFFRLLRTALMAITVRYAVSAPSYSSTFLVPLLLRSILVARNPLDQPVTVPSQYLSTMRM